MMGTVGDATKRKQEAADSQDNQLFMTFLQHGDASKMAKTKPEPAVKQKKSLLKKTLTKQYNNSSGEELPTITTVHKKKTEQVTRFEAQEIVSSVASENIVIKSGENIEVH